MPDWSDNLESVARGTRIRESQITLGTACLVVEKAQAPKGELTVSTAIEKLEAARLRAMAGGPKVGGFPYLAETLRQAGVTRNL